MSRWKVNLGVLCFAQLVTLTGFSAYLPFIPYYVQELGISSTAAVATWVAAFDSGSALAMMLFGPIWGTLADRHGRKMMLVRATLAGAVLAFLMGLARTPTQLIILRILQGALCGTVAAANTMVATDTPDKYLGRGLGILQTIQYAGHALGPFVGGLLADTVGYRAVFPISAAMITVSLLSITFLVREDFHPAARTHQEARGSRREMRTALAGGNTLVLLLALASNSFAVAILSPVMSLYIRSLSPATGNLATMAGAVVSIAAVTSSLSALAIGGLADRIGQKVVLVVCVIGAALIYIPQALATSAMQLLVLRGIQGVMAGGIMPTANALLAKSTPARQRGMAFGLATSAQAGGRSLGPLVGAGIANVYGLGSPFWATAGVYALIAALVGVFVRSMPAAAEPEPAVGNTPAAAEASPSQPTKL